jgi:hypothetical protein
MKVENFKYDSDTRKGDCCPECNAAWDGGDIYEYFLEAKFNPNHQLHDYYKDKSLIDIKKSIESYGWTDKTPKRFGRVIGLDCSMDPNADKEDQYDGVSYWQCPECQISWNRFTGERTEKFVKKTKSVAEMMVSDAMRMALGEEIEDERQIIYNAIKTPDGTIISSDHRHDYVTHTDKNGKTYGVDGGCEYLRRIGDCGDCEDLSLYLEKWTPEFHEKARQVVKRGGRGKDGMQPLTWVPICEMNDSWVLATIKYNTERGMGIDKSWFTNLLHEEMHYRNANGITIKEEEHAKK